MNTAKSVFNYQLGLAKWNMYDDIVKRFVCERENDFNEILPDGLNQESETPIFACKYSPCQGYQHILALANESGKIALINTKKSCNSRNGGSAHNNAIFDVAWLPNARKMVTASGDHTSALLDVSSGSVTVERVFLGHTRSLKTVACREDDLASFATGGRDGRIILWDLRVDSEVLTLSSPALFIPYTHFHNTQIRDTLGRGKNVHVSASNSVTTVVFQDYNTLISCGSGDGFIKVWDMRKSYYAKNRAPAPKYYIPYAGSTLKNGFSHLVIDHDRNILYASCLDNIIYSYNIGTYNPEPIMKHYGHKNRTFYVKMCLSADGNYLLSGSSDNNAYIWHRNKSTPLVKLVGHDAEVTCVAWSAVDNNLLTTCSDDLKHRFWTLSSKEVASDKIQTEYAGYAETYVGIESEMDTAAGPDSENQCTEGVVASCSSIELQDPKMVCYQDGKWIQKTENEGTSENIDNSHKSKDQIHKNKDEVFQNRLDENINQANEYIDKKHVNITKIDKNAEFMHENDKIFRTEKLSENSIQNIERTPENVSRVHEAANSKKRPLDTEDLNSQSTSTSLNGDSDNFESTEKRARLNSIGSLLADLPSFNIDGRAPHLNMSPMKQPEKDWLTQLRLKKASTSHIHQLSPQSPSNTEKLSHKPPVKRPNTPHSESPLLRYFKVTNSPTTSRAKSPIISLSSRTPD